MALIFDAVNGFRDTGTSALGLPSGTTAQRPPNAYNGYMRFNTDLGIIETFLPSVGWGAYSGGTYTAEILLIGAGGGSSGTGGGGAGGMLYSNTVTLNAGSTYTFTVGAGGVADISQGGSTFHGSLNALGGGTGAPGGSGGGSTHSQNVYGPLYIGTTGQGTPGGRGYYHNDNSGHHHGGGGGGGGAGTPGANSPTSGGGAGGAGLISNITGANVHYSGGGGGGRVDNRSSGAGGGTGGGGHGHTPSQNAVAGSPHLGGGAGGGGANGGSGVVILKYISASVRGTGGVITTQTVQTVVYQIHTFLATTNYIA
jgi:hypothetical protein